MGTAVTPTPDPIPLPDLRRPDKMPSLPAWLELRVASMSDVHQPDQVTGIHRLATTLPSNLSLNQAERAMIEQHVEKLDRVCGQTPEQDPDAAGEMLIVLTDMCMALPSVRQTEASAEARGKAFMIAVEDIPVWAVEATKRLWYRGQCGEDERGMPYDYTWTPSPAALRRVSSVELYRVKSRADTLRKLLCAEPLIEYSAEHCEMMLGRLSVLMHETYGFSPVGNDTTAAARGSASS